MHELCLDDVLNGGSTSRNFESVMKPRPSLPTVLEIDEAYKTTGEGFTKRSLNKSVYG